VLVIESILTTVTPFFGMSANNFAKLQRVQNNLARAKRHTAEAEI